MFYNKFLEKFALPIGDFINNSQFIKDLRYWRNVDTYSEKELKQLQASNLKKLLKHAVSKATYYKGIALRGNSPIEWLSNFPILSKEDLRNNQKLILTEDTSKLTKISSSGSTGINTSVYMNSRDLSSLRAGLIHWWEWSGYKMGMPLIQTGISPDRGVLKSIKDFLFNTTYVSAFSHTDNQLKKICKKLSRKSNFFLVGYASSLNVIASYAIKNNYNIQLKAIISLGDKLFSQYRKNLYAAFNCEVFDTYGSAEGFLIAAQADNEYLYVLSPQTYIEIVDHNNNPVPDGELGHIVVTRLDGYAMPLIRYKIGDLGILLPKSKYPKNRKFQYPILQQIIGRDTDIVKTPKGKVLVVHSFTGIFEYFTEIKQFKVVQLTLDGISIEYIPSDDFTDKVLEKIKNEIQKNIEEEHFVISFKRVSRILPTQSGKPQIIESHL